MHIMVNPAELRHFGLLLSLYGIDHELLVSDVQK